MLREQCKVGMHVVFGRLSGEKTKAVVLKLNPRRAKLRTLEPRAGKPEGVMWNVPYSLFDAPGVERQPEPPAYPLGLSIVAVRTMTTAEKEAEGWDHSYLNETSVLVLSDGSVIYASADYEGNGAGALFGRTNTGEHFTVG